MVAFRRINWERCWKQKRKKKNCENQKTNKEKKWKSNQRNKEWKEKEMGK